MLCVCWIRGHNAIYSRRRAHSPAPAPWPLGSGVACPETREVVLSQPGALHGSACPQPQELHVWVADVGPDRGSRDQSLLVDAASVDLAGNA